MPGAGHEALPQQRSRYKGRLHVALVLRPSYVALSELYPAGIAVGVEVTNCQVCADCPILEAPGVGQGNKDRAGVDVGLALGLGLNEGCSCHCLIPFGLLCVAGYVRSPRTCLLLRIVILISYDSTK